jgi:mRNA interferase RelE/StbE
MMSEKIWSVEFTPNARKKLERLEDKLFNRIFSKIGLLESMVNPLDQKDMRLLEGEFEGLYRFRVGEYRILLEFNTIHKRIVIHSVLPRGRAYRS